jgi:hypothetical protein
LDGFSEDDGALLHKQSVTAAAENPEGTPPDPKSEPQAPAVVGSDGQGTVPQKAPGRSDAISSADENIDSKRKAAYRVPDQNSFTKKLNDVGPVPPRPIRIRNKHHLEFVASRPCLVCGREPCDPHHLRFAQPRALGRKVSDEYTVPLCRIHHRELHRQVNEEAWWSLLNIDPTATALQLWQHTRGLLVPAVVSHASGQLQEHPTNSGTARS